MSEFYSRQEWFLSHKNIKDLRILIVGTGAIGRNVASLVSRLGPKSITLVDHDIIEEHNISPQNWRAEDCGNKKVLILAREIISQSSNINVTTIDQRWTPKLLKDYEFDAVWATVDNIDVRRALYMYYRDKTKMFFDVRIGGPIAQIFSVTNLEEITDDNDWYIKTFFSQGEASNFGCINPMSNYLASVAVGLSVNEFVKAINGKNWPLNKMLTFDVMTAQTSSEDPISYFESL